MQGCAGIVGKMHYQDQFFNDLEKLDPTYRPSQISIWSANNKVASIVMHYSNGDTKTHGPCKGPATHILSLANNGSEVITEMVVRESVNETGIASITSLSIATSTCQVLDTAIITEKKEEPTPTPDEEKLTTKEQTKPAEVPKETRSYTWSKPDENQWSVRGFFGFVNKDEGPIYSIGIVWGKDHFVPVPSARICSPLCKNFLGLSPALQGNITRFQTLPVYHLLSEKFLMGNSVSTKAKGSLSYFNALDTIDLVWKMKTIVFASKDRKLCGIRVIYHNGEEVTHGTYSAETETWRCEVRSELVIAKMTAGKAEDGGPAYIDTVEFVRADAEQQLPAWPLHLSTLRYLGEGDVRVSKDVEELVELAPKVGNAKWSVRGFYGEVNEGFITRLGMVWGRA